MRLTLLRIGFFGAAHGCRDQKVPLPKIRHTYPTMKLGTVLSYLKKIQKYMNHVTHSLSSADIGIFHSGIRQILLHQEIQM